MINTPHTTELQSWVVHMPATVKLSAAQFREVCRANRDWRFERTADGDIVIMPPTGSETGARRLQLALQLGRWAEQDGSGVAFDSSTGFVLPNEAIRSPDVAWVSRQRLATLSARQKRTFAPLCPDFVVELKSPTDRLRDLQAKLREYIANGTRLGWLIDPQARTAYVYRPHVAVQRPTRPMTLSGDPVLRGFTLHLDAIWDPRV